VDSARQSARHAIHTAQELGEGRFAGDVADAVATISQQVSEAERGLAEAEAQVNRADEARLARVNNVTQRWLAVHSSTVALSGAVAQAESATAAAAAAVEGARAAAESARVAAEAAAAAAEAERSHAAAARKSSSAGWSDSVTGVAYSLAPGTVATVTGALGSMGLASGGDGRSRASSVTTVHLPPAWKRLSDPGTGRVYFQNEETKVTVWDLPTMSEYDVTWRYDGPLGLQLVEKDDPEGGMTMMGPRKICTVVSSTPGNGEGSEHLGAGHVLLSVNGYPAGGRSLNELYPMILSTPRPLTLRFSNPHAVTAEVAEQAKNPACHVVPLTPAEVAAGHSHSRSDGAFPLGVGMMGLGMGMGSVRAGDMVGAMHSHATSMLSGMMGATAGMMAGMGARPAGMPFGGPGSMSSSPGGWPAAGTPVSIGAGGSIRIPGFGGGMPGAGSMPGAYPPAAGPGYPPYGAPGYPPAGGGYGGV